VNCIPMTGPSETPVGAATSSVQPMASGVVAWGPPASTQISGIADSLASINQNGISSSNVSS
jgi:hypothetical protein